MSLETFSTVDPSDLTRAEADIRNDFKNNGMLVSHTVHKELVLVPDDTIMDVRKQYSHMCDVYASYNVDINTKLKQTEKIVDNIVSTLVQSVNRPIVEWKWNDDSIIIIIIIIILVITRYIHP